LVDKDTLAPKADVSFLSISRKNINFAVVMKRMLLIINPISGTANKNGLAERIVKKLAEHEIHVDIANTTCRGDATRLSHEGVASGYDAILACGGDGTVNETARALANTGVTMGIIPAGSGNGLARHIGIPIDPMQSLQIIIDHHINDCDYGTVNGQPFFCTFGVGFDAAVSDRFAASGQRGKMSYIKSAFEEFIKFKCERYTLKSEGKVITDDAFLIACCNASQYGNNAYIAPHASIIDGLLDVIIIRKASILERAMLGLDLISGTIDQNKLIETLRVKNVVIERSGIGSAHIDGEPVTLGDKLEVECHAAALRLFTPTIQDDFKPIITPVEDMLRDLSIKVNSLIG
jgi:YegS/Rv2252/BmrU family lipid kinase